MLYLDSKCNHRCKELCPKTENEQVEVLNTLLTMMKIIDINGNTNLLLAGDFNVFLIQI